MSTKHIRAVAFREGDVWVVHGVEYDIVAQAKDPLDAPEAFIRTLLSTLMINRRLGRSGFERLNSAPSKYRDMFERANRQIKSLEQPQVLDDLPRPRLDLRVYRQEAA